MKTGLGSENFISDPRGVWKRARYYFYIGASFLEGLIVVKQLEWRQVLLMLATVALVAIFVYSVKKLD